MSVCYTGGTMADVEFETIKADEIKFGRNNFLEIARKKAVSEEGSNEFIAISRGYFLPDGTKRFRRSLAVPDEKEIIDFITSKLQELHKEMSKSAKPKKESSKTEEAEKEAGPEKAESETEQKE